MTARVERICRYPVKGMSAEELPEVTLTVGQRMPEDRRFAIARGSSEIDSSSPEWRSPESFVTLMRTEKLAQLRTRYDAETGQLTVLRGGKPVSTATITDPLGRVVIEQFLAAFLSGDVQRAPKLVDAGAALMTDVPEPYISLINLASVRDLERVVGKPVDPLRFRGNVYLDGLEPWEEMQWIGKTVTLGGARLEVAEPIERCAATTVNPETAERDINIPKELQRGYRHVNMGVYASVVESGRVAVGDAVEV